mgnify:CR=1 FL=1
MEIVGMAIASILVGLGVGVLSGLLGIGGGTILVPVFKLGFGLSAIASTATSLFTIIPTSVSGAISHIRNKSCIPKLGVAAGLGGAVTSSLGVWLASISPDWAIMVAAAIIIGYSSFTMLKKAASMKPAKRAADATAGATEGATAAPEPEALPPVPSMSAKQLAIGAAIGLVAGVASGYVGVGGGFIMVPLMTQLLSTPMKLTSGTSLIAVMILAIPGVIEQALLGNVHWVIGIAIACGSIPGAAIGARLVQRVPERTLRFIFGGFLLVAAALLVVEQCGLLG